MSGLVGSELLGAGSVRLAGDDGGGGGGSGNLNNVTSVDGSVIVTSPSADTRDLSENGVYQLIDSYGLGNDSPAINAALASLAARPHNNGVLEGPAGSHRLRSSVIVPTGCSVKWAGKEASTLLVEGNGFDAITMTDARGVSISDCTIKALAPRTSGIAIHVKGGNPAIQPFFNAGGYTLSANEVQIDRVDMFDQFDGVVIENNGLTAAWLAYIRDGLFTGMNGGDGIRIDCPGATPLTYGASFFVQRMFVFGNAATPELAGNALHIRGAGDFTIEKFQAALTNIGLLIDPPAGGRLSTGRFSLCQFDTAAAFNVHIIPADTAVFGDIDFSSCWFAGASVHGVLINGQAARGIRFGKSFFFFSGQYGLVMTGLATGCSEIDVTGCHFSGAGTGGVRVVNARNFNIADNQFYPSLFPPITGMPQAVTIDAGCQDFLVHGNTWTKAAAGLLDNSGDVDKAIYGNIPTSTLEVVADFSGVLQPSEGPVFCYLANAGIGEAIVPANNQVDPCRYPTSARTIRRLRGCAPLGTGADPVTFVLYKNGAPTAMSCTIAAGQPAGAKAVDSGHPIVFVDGDDYDVRVDGTLAASLSVSASLEGPPPGP